jgi:hypothetical protein
LNGTARIVTSRRRACVFDVYTFYEENIGFDASSALPRGKKITLIADYR